MLITGGVIFIIAGLIFKSFPPKTINHIYGFRSGFSMRSQAVWDEAQRYSANSMIITGIITVALGFLFSPFAISISDGYKMLIFLACTFGMLVLDEVHLRKKFDRNGVRRQK